MDFRDYLTILRRRWAVVAFVTVVALAVGGAFTLRGPRSYEGTARMAVSVGADGQSNLPPYYSREYYSWLASEYLADDLGEIVKSDAFLTDVRAYLDTDLRGALVRDVVRARKTHRILEVTVQAPQPEQARQMAAAISDVVREQGHKYLAQLATPGGRVVVIDAPSVRPATTTGSLVADIGLRAALGFLVGLFLAFVVDYVDSTLRTAREVERTLGLPILGEIPGETR